MIIGLSLLLTGCVSQIVVTEYENQEPVRSIEVQMMSDFVAMPVDAMPSKKGEVMSGYPHLNPVSLRMNTYWARELYYKVLEEYPDLRGRVRVIVIGVPDTTLEADFVSDAGSAYIRDEVVYVKFAGR